MLKFLSILALVVLSGCATVEQWAPVFDRVDASYAPDDEVSVTLEGLVHGSPSALDLRWDLDGCTLTLTLMGGGLSYTQQWVDVCGVEVLPEGGDGL